MGEKNKMRLQKFLSMAGIASRRKSEEIIKSGLIKINNKIVYELGAKINPEHDIIFYKDKKITAENYIYLMLNKPVGFVTTVHDELNRKTVLDLIDVPQKIFPVGRLDLNTSGLLLLTNDGDLTYKLTHPKHNINKIYLAKLTGELKSNEKKKFCNGLIIENKKTAPAEIKIIKQENNFCLVKIKIHEGRKRQIRKMCEKINHKVISLKRIAIGNLKLDIKSGTYRFLSQKEINYLKSV